MFVTTALLSQLIQIFTSDTDGVRPDVKEERVRKTFLFPLFAFSDCLNSFIVIIIMVFCFSIIKLVFRAPEWLGR